MIVELIIGKFLVNGQKFGFCSWIEVLHQQNPFTLLPGVQREFRPCNSVPMWCKTCSKSLCFPVGPAWLGLPPECWFFWIHGLANLIWTLSGNWKFLLQITILELNTLPVHPWQSSSATFQWIDNRLAGTLMQINAVGNKHCQNKFQGAHHPCQNWCPAAHMPSPMWINSSWLLLLLELTPSPKGKIVHNSFLGFWWFILDMFLRVTANLVPVSFWFWSVSFTNTSSMINDSQTRCSEDNHSHSQCFLVMLARLNNPAFPCCPNDLGLPARVLWLPRRLQVLWFHFSAKMLLIVGFFFIFFLVLFPGEPDLKLVCLEIVEFQISSWFVWRIVKVQFFPLLKVVLWV